MANEAIAVNHAGARIDADYDTMCAMMDDLSDGTLDGWADRNNNGRCDNGEWTASTLSYTDSNNWSRGYELGGQTFVVDSKSNGVYSSAAQDATKPGFMLKATTANTNAQVQNSQLADRALAASKLKQATAQKI